MPIYVESGLKVDLPVKLRQPKSYYFTICLNLVVNNKHQTDVTCYDVEIGFRAQI